MSFNKIIIIGNLGGDPELRYTPQGDAVCNFSVAVNDRKRDKTGEYQDITTWYKVTMWRKMAENASKYLTKGRPVYIEGRLAVDEWTDRDGKSRYTLEINGTEMQFIGGRDDENFSNRASESANDFADDSADRDAADTAAAPTAAVPSDDDIPF